MFKKVLCAGLVVSSMPMCAEQVVVPKAELTAEQIQQAQDLKHDARIFNSNAVIAPVIGCTTGSLLLKTASDMGYVQGSVWHYFLAVSTCSLVSNWILGKIKPIKNKELAEYKNTTDIIACKHLMGLVLSTALIKSGARLGYINESFWKHFGANIFVARTLLRKELPKFLEAACKVPEDVRNAVLKDVKEESCLKSFC